MRWEIDALRSQRHDFINHVQIITALLSEGRREELARYVKALKED
ncbi:Spo0B domain-containing protein [Desulfofundulus thermosubterraneus]|nr:Spo0B domain-containing protein [Desulfofundulus thermosubterraneus]